MTSKPKVGLFVAEGSSDQPLATIVQSLFFERGVELHLSAPDFQLLPQRVRKDVKSKIQAGIELSGQVVELIVVHRDSDNVGREARRNEILQATLELDIGSSVVPVIPVRMTEAWLLLDEPSIRHVAGNPRGKVDLGLPKHHEVERKADPKKLLQECLVAASGVTGRRKERVVKRFDQHRKQLLERLDPNGPVAALDSRRQLIADVDAIVGEWQTAPH